MRIFDKRELSRRNQPRHRRLSFEALEDRMLLAGDIVMYNDHVAGPSTHSFTTTYSTVGVSSGLLRDSATGATTPILLQTQSNGAGFESVVGEPATGTDADTIFGGWVDFTSQPASSIALSGSATYTHAFSGLNLERTYDFAGTAVRGNSGYTNRWALVTLVGAESYTMAHSAGLGVVTAGLPDNQVALWTGENHEPDQGFVVQWKNIDPGPDGSFEVVSQQYLGPTPGVGTGNASTGSKGYALTAVRLTELDPTFRVVDSEPPSGAVLTSAPTSYVVHFNLPVDASTVQPSDLKVDGQPATVVQILDVDSVEFALPALAGEGFHTVAIANGSILSSGNSLPTAQYTGSFAILSGAGIVINEVNYDSGSDADPWEYIELFNAGSGPVDLSGWQLADAVSFTIPDGTVIGSGEYLLISQHPGELQGRYGVSSLGPFDGRLSNDGETIELRDNAGVIQDEVDYQLGFPWPTIGDIPGRSIQLMSPALANDLGGNWRSAGVTPGAANSVLALNSPPQMRQVDHSPNSPVSGQDVTVTMKVTDPEGVASVALEYQLVDPGDYIAINDPRYAANWTTLPMRDDGAGGDAVAGDDVYSGVLPSSLQVHRRLVRYRVTATDGLGASVTAPYADDPQPNFAYFVYDATPDWTGAAQPGVTPPVTYDSELLDSVATYHLITTRKAHEDSQFIPDSTRNNGYGGSDYLWHGALVYDGVVYDHIRFRARGGVWRYAMGKNMWKFDFNRGHGFEARDDYGNKYEIPWNKLNLSAIIQQGNFWHRGEQGLFEAVGFKLFNLAGVAASNTNYVHFRIIESADENGADQFSGDFQGLYLSIEQLDDQFLEQHGLPDGNLYKMEGGTGVGGIGGESNNQGDYPEVDDSSDLISFKTTYQSGPQTAQWWRDNFNLESYYSYRSIVEGIHHYDIGAGKNYFYYHNPETGQWETLPWDIDLTWADNMFGDGNEPFRSRVLAIAEFALDYRNRMREVRDLLYNPEQVGLLVDEIASFVYTPGQPSFVDADRAMWDYNPILVSNYVDSSKAAHGRFYAGGGGYGPFGSFVGMMQALKDYSIERSDWIDDNILTDDNVIPNTPTITYTGDAGFPLNGLRFTSSPFSGRGNPFQAMEWRIGEVYHPGTANYVEGTPWKYEIDAAWESGELSTFNSVLDVSGAGLQAGHTYRARVRMQDTSGRWSHWSDPAEFVAAPPVGVATLAITELHYHPHNPDLADESDQEFIEIQNFGTEAIDLSGMQIADFASTPYVFADGLSLEPGQRIVVARSPQVFTSIYGSVVNLAPDGYGDANLSNSGETVTLRDATGSLIRSFTYSDSSPWPTAPDGGGPSLEIIDPKGDPNDPTNWRASLASGGSPGSDGAPTIAGDYDGNGVVEQQDHLFWRANFGKQVTPGSGADGTGDGMVDAADYVFWRMQHAAQMASAATVAALSPPTVAEPDLIVPAPTVASGREENKVQVAGLTPLAIELKFDRAAGPVEPGSRGFRPPTNRIVTLRSTDLLLASGVIGVPAENEQHTGLGRRLALEEIDQALDSFDSTAAWAEVELLATLEDEFAAFMR